MKFKVEFELDTDRDSAPFIGEYLRAKFWPGEGYGCYSNFQFGPDIKELEPRIHEWDDKYWDGTEEAPYHVVEKWVRAEWQDIICEYYWDGDGMLRFIFPDGSSIFNSDCKKASCWEWEALPDEPVC